MTEVNNTEAFTIFFDVTNNQNKFIDLSLGCFVDTTIFNKKGYLIASKAGRKGEEFLHDSEMKKSNNTFNYSNLITRT